MTHVPHELAEEFPDHKDANYEMNRKFRRIEMDVMPTADDFKNRLHHQHFAHNDELSTEI